MACGFCEIFSIFFAPFLWNPPALKLFITKPLENNNPKKPFEGKNLDFINIPKDTPKTNFLTCITPA